MPTTDMRFNICVIDDIKSTVEMIATKIPWDTYGIKVVGTAKNGEEGLALIQETRPDIILTDIRMPRMDGLKMTRRMIDLLPQCKVIILSAYTDFEYAKQAIRLGAFDFVKKPFSIQEITKVVLEAKQALESEYNRQERIQAMEKKVQESLPLLRQEYCGRLLQHELRPEEAQDYWQEMHVELEPEGLAVLIIEIDHFMDKYASQPIHEIELVRFALHNIIEETIHGETRGVVVRDGPSYYACIINSRLEEEARRIAEACCENIASCTKFTISIGVGTVVKAVHELPQSYKSALSALAYHFYTGGNGAFSLGDVPKEQEAYPRYDQAKEQELLISLRAGNPDKSLLALERLFDDVTQLHPLPDPQYVRSMYYELALVILRTFYELVPLAVLQPYDQQIRDRSSQALDSIKPFQQLLRDLCQAGCTWIEKERVSDSTQLIHRAVEYIRSHLQLDLTVEHCARQMSISGGHFANLFKKVTGTTLNQFVTAERIERAKRLLIENYQVQEIALSLGYEHRRYFSEVFKKHTGQTPSEFKDAYIGQK
ncbi:response regulator [Paenibacillus filicis]|uniref:Response regulator n=1 Tax=Paenibacillus gyeongsangnamensis TaxID=3388067 RepID=A0ABT4QIQ1_9BACL|nr:response regulator [Paenibacillus filicis]MCZ8516576.1 response regulator [Paenibacillus filicis]